MASSASAAATDSGRKILHLQSIAGSRGGTLRGGPVDAASETFLACCNWQHEVEVVLAEWNRRVTSCPLSLPDDVPSACMPG